MAARYWVVSGGASLIAHGALFAGLGMAMAPEPVEQQPVPKSQLTVTSYQVDQSQAAAKTPEGKAASEAEPKAPRMGEGAIARVDAVLAQIDAPVLDRTEAGGQKLASGKAEGERSAARELEAKNAEGAEAVGQNLAPADVEGSRAEVSLPEASSIDAADARAEAADAVQPSAESLQTAELAAEQSADIALSAEVVGAVAAVSQSLKSRAAPSAQAVPSVAATSAPIKSQVMASLKATAAPAPTSFVVAASSAVPEAKLVQAVVQMAAVTSSSPQAQIARPAVAKATRPASTQVPDNPALQVAAPSQIAPLKAPKSTRAASRDLPSEFATAALAWNGSDELSVDPVSLAAIQAFMQPSDLGAGGGESEVRDGIEAVLASVPCARLQTEFDPDTGSLQLRGHIPEDGLRGPILEAIKAQIGGSIPIEDTLLILPRPQCGALSGIGEVGLPQSTDQITNPRVVGPQGFARNYAYSNGQRLILELIAPDYPSVVYVDYFTADGMVLHLQPNTIVPLEAYAPKSGFTVGKEREDGPSLNLTVSPPFGQEIAVAFAASVPIYDDLRPISEPAEPYLKFLREQITQARARDPKFKGEWVYFFISTTPQ